jgi:hypothetical protein
MITPGDIPDDLPAYVEELNKPLQGSIIRINGQDFDINMPNNKVRELEQLQ